MLSFQLKKGRSRHKRAVGIFLLGCLSASERDGSLCLVLPTVNPQRWGMGTCHFLERRRKVTLWLLPHPGQKNVKGVLFCSMNRSPWGRGALRSGSQTPRVSSSVLQVEPRSSSSIFIPGEPG